MNKRNRSNQNKKPAESKAQEQGTLLGDMLNPAIAEKLKNIKKEKEQELQKQKEEEQARKLFEQKQREKNKSFGELFNESQLDWKKFK